jgi:hypothetical protein
MPDGYLSPAGHLAREKAEVKAEVAVRRYPTD